MTENEMIEQVKNVLDTHGYNITRDKYHEVKPETAPSWCKLYKTFGSWGEVKRRAKALNVDTAPGHVVPEFVDKKTGELDWRRVINAAIEMQDIRNNNSWTQDICRIEIPTDKPVAIMFTSDEHIGSMATDYDAWLNSIDYLFDTPGLYAVNVGDPIENQKKFRTVSPILSQVISPTLQPQVYGQVLLEMFNRGKLLAMSGGNHDLEFDERIFGEGDLKQYAERLVPYFDGKGLVELVVGDVTYRILMMHKTRYHSFINTLHGAKREYQLTLPADIVVTAHTHKPGFEEYHHYQMAAELGLDFGGVSFLIQTGTFKVNDTYSKRYWTKGVIGTPTVVLHPDRREMDYFRTPEKAVDFIRGINNNEYANDGTGK